jgi:hypothetical protein
MSLVLVMVLSFTACTEETEEEVELPSAQEIVDGVIESLDEIKSHKFDTSVSLVMAGEAEGEAVEFTIEFNISGAVDIENKQIKVVITGSYIMPGVDEPEIAWEWYIIDDMAYIMTERPREGPMWQKDEFSETDWEEITEVLGFAERQVELLQAADISIIGSEKIKGVDCYVLQLTPYDMEQLWKTAMEETDPLDMGVPAIAEEVLREAFASFSVKQWVTKDTYFLTKSEIDISMELTPEVKDAIGIGGELAGMRTTNIVASWLFYDYNQVSIELPPEAEEAIEVPME